MAARALGLWIVAEPVIERLVSCVLVGLYGGFPVTDPHIYVRGHVYEMRCGRLHGKRGQPVRDQERPRRIVARLHGMYVEVEQSQVVGLAREAMLNVFDELLGARFRIA